jgi:hypothetical protein
MPTHSQITVEAVATDGALGSSDSATLQEMFPASPIYAGELTSDVITDMGNGLLIFNGVNDGGHTFGTFDRDYKDAPVIDDVATGGGGLPGSPHTPAPGSPGPGSMNPADIPEPPSDWPPEAGTEYGSGPGGLLSPSDSSKLTSQQTIGDYLFGKSSS